MKSQVLFQPGLPRERLLAMATTEDFPSLFYSEFLFFFILKNQNKKGRESLGTYQTVKVADTQYWNCPKNIPTYLP
jgi:hypothetical protein